MKKTRNLLDRSKRFNLSYSPYLSFEHSSMEIERNSKFVYLKNKLMEFQSKKSINADGLFSRQNSTQFNKKVYKNLHCLLSEISLVLDMKRQEELLTKVQHWYFQKFGKVKEKRDYEKTQKSFYRTQKDQCDSLESSEAKGLRINTENQKVRSKFMINPVKTTEIKLNYPGSANKDEQNLGYKGIFVSYTPEPKKVLREDAKVGNESLLGSREMLGKEDFYDKRKLLYTGFEVGRKKNIKIGKVFMSGEVILDRMKNEKRNIEKSFEYRKNFRK